jgi:hypothetical protein
VCAESTLTVDCAEAAFLATRATMADKLAAETLVIVRNRAHLILATSER